MKFNTDKFEEMSFGLNEEQAYNAPDGKLIKQNKFTKDLGVYASTKLNFTSHIANIVAREWTIGFLGRSNTEML